MENFFDSLASLNDVVQQAFGIDEGNYGSLCSNLIESRVKLENLQAQGSGEMLEAKELEEQIDAMEKVRNDYDNLCRELKVSLQKKMIVEYDQVLDDSTDSQLLQRIDDNKVSLRKCIDQGQENCKKSDKIT